jgi:hypothetical protein
MILVEHFLTLIVQKYQIPNTRKKIPQQPSSIVHIITNKFHCQVKLFDCKTNMIDFYHLMIYNSDSISGAKRINCENEFPP